MQNTNVITKFFENYFLCDFEIKNGIFLEMVGDKDTIKINDKII